MFRHLCFAILALTLMPAAYSLADDMPMRSRASGAPPLILAQSDNRDLCARRCEIDYQTCAQYVRENSSDGNYGGYQLLPRGTAESFNQAALDGCETKFKYCNRNCDRP